MKCWGCGSTAHGTLAARRNGRRGQRQKRINAGRKNIKENCPIWGLVKCPCTEKGHYRQFCKNNGIAPGEGEDQEADDKILGSDGILVSEVDAAKQSRKGRSPGLFEREGSENPRSSEQREAPKFSGGKDVKSKEEKERLLDEKIARISKQNAKVVQRCSEVKQDQKLAQQMGMSVTVEHKEKTIELIELSLTPSL